MIPDDQPIFSPEELGIMKTVARSKVWRLMRDALCLRREQLFNATPSFDNDREIWAREGALREVNRLLREGPRLAVYYDRYVRAEQEKGEEPLRADAPPVPRPDEPPDL